jgi:hypothetical protein
LSWRDIEDIRESTQSFESLAVFGSLRATWNQDDHIEELPALNDIETSPTYCAFVRRWDGLFFPPAPIRRAGCSDQPRVVASAIRRKV